MIISLLTLSHVVSCESILKWSQGVVYTSSTSDNANDKGRAKVWTSPEQCIYSFASLMDTQGQVPKACRRNIWREASVRKALGVLRSFTKHHKNPLPRNKSGSLDQWPLLLSPPTCVYYPLKVSLYIGNV